MIELLHITKRTNLGYKGTILNKKFGFSFDDAHILDGNHTLYISYSKKPKMATYVVLNEKEKVTLALSTFIKGNYELINVVEASFKNKYKAVNLYSFLLRVLNKILVSKEQSSGGIKLWEDLSKVKGISICGWDFNNDVAINTDKFLRDKEDLYVSRDLKRYHPEIARINLVAFAK